MSDAVILGLNDGHDAGVALVTPDGEVLFAANEERYTGRKQQWGFPHRSLEQALACTGVRGRDVNAVAFGFEGLVETELSSALGREDVGLTRALFTRATAVAGPVMETRAATALIRAAGKVLRRNRLEIGKALAAAEIAAPLTFTSHHEAHAASAWMTSGWDRATVLTLDAGGDGQSGSLWLGRDGTMEPLAGLPRIHSLGDFWLAVTLLCGFNPDRHGGKITGLAAYRPCPEALDAMRRLYAPVPGRFLFRNRRYLFWKRLVEGLRRELAPFNREEIAWGAQKLLEELVNHLVTEALRQTGEGRIAAAGGIFANVKLNLEVLRRPDVQALFIHPHMGDGGIALGAALREALRQGARPRRVRHVFWGDEAGPVDRDALAGLHVRRAGSLDELAAHTARLLAAGKVLGVVRGRMEYGPRALTNRSILFHPFDPTVMDWLNERLDRTEFMPFAPVMPVHRAAEYFELADKGEFPARFMTVCFDARPGTREAAPAITHVDGTARPQLVDSTDAPFVAKVLEHFDRQTGVPILINTSFNRHEQPIVRMASQGIEELRRGVVEVLVLDDCLVARDASLLI